MESLTLRLIFFLYPSQKICCLFLILYKKNERITIFYKKLYFERKIVLFRGTVSYFFIKMFYPRGYPWRMAWTRPNTVFIESSPCYIGFSRRKKYDYISKWSLRKLIRGSRLDKFNIIEMHCNECCLCNNIYMFIIIYIEKCFISDIYCG